MVQLNKKNASGRGKDFEKQKAKVGKLKPGAVNATDTKFKSKKICLRTQQLSTAQKIESFAKESSQSKDSLAVIFKPIFSQTGHYNVNIRREAFSSLLKKCREQDEDKIEEILGRLMEIICKGMIDQEGSVRGIALALNSWIFESKLQSVNPFLNDWIQYLKLACTHIKEEIRSDALKYINCLIQYSSLQVLSFTTNLLNLLTNFNAKTSVKSKSPKPYELATLIMQKYIQAKSHREKIQFLNYNWQSNQKISLRTCLIRRSKNEDSLLDDISEGELQKILSWYAGGIIDDWLEIIPSLNNPHFSEGKGAGSANLLGVNNAFKIMKDFAIISGNDTSILIHCLPNVIQKNPHLPTMIEKL